MDEFKCFESVKEQTYPRWQLEYDRLFTRIIDNTKVLEATGLKQENFMPLYEGLKYEVSRCPDMPE